MSARTNTSASASRPVLGYPGSNRGRGGGASLERVGQVLAAGLAELPGELVVTKLRRLALVTGFRGLSRAEVRG